MFRGATPARRELLPPVPSVFDHRLSAPNHHVDSEPGLNSASLVRAQREDVRSRGDPGIAKGQLETEFGMSPSIECRSPVSDRVTQEGTATVARSNAAWHSRVRH